MTKSHHSLYLKKLGIDTYNESVVYMHKDCHVCRSEGFEAQARIQVTLDERSIIATLNVIDSDILNLEEAGLSNHAWNLLGAAEGKQVFFSHPRLLSSIGHIRSKVYGNPLNDKDMRHIINDVVAGNLSDIELSAFLTSCAGNRLSEDEITSLTRAMIDTGQKIVWSVDSVVDKHCVGGLPGNRTSIILVAIVAAFGLLIPKTSSRAITSPSGTADTMEVFAPVDLNISAMKKVVEKENGCIVWGGSVALSPADDMLIRVEHVLDLDSEGQLVASVLSKKIAAGSNQILIDIPVGPTAKVRSIKTADLLKGYLKTIGEKFGVHVRCVYTDGYQPVGRGIGPALEARDVLAVLRCDKAAPQDLRDRALTLAGLVLEFSPKVAKGSGKQVAQSILDNGSAWRKFQGICEAQGGMHLPTITGCSYPVLAKSAGRITAIDNRRLARVAKLAGAPRFKSAGIDLLTPLQTLVEINQPLYTIYAETKSELDYALSYVHQEHGILTIEDIA